VRVEKIKGENMINSKEKVVTVDYGVKACRTKCDRYWNFCGKNYDSRTLTDAYSWFSGLKTEKTINMLIKDGYIYLVPESGEGEQVDIMIVFDLPNKEW
jgi:hypothetical protein